MKPPERIVIFLPKENEAGGAQILFARIAEKLIIEDNQYLVLIVDYPGGYISTYLRAYAAEIINILEASKVTLNKSDLLFTSLVYIGQINDFFEFHNQTRLLYWELGPYSLIENQILSSYYRRIGIERASSFSDNFEKNRKKKFSEFIHTATKHKGLLFMCGKNYYYNKLFYKLDEITLNYLPIPVKVANKGTEQYGKGDVNYDIINIAWMSRLFPKKCKPLYCLIDDISNYIQNSNQDSIELFIIGEGPEKQNLQQYGHTRKARISFTGRLEKDKLDEFLKQNIHLSFAMGTSALEFGKLKIPAVLTLGEQQLNSDEMYKKKYRFLFDSEKFNLSSEPTLGNKNTLLSFKNVVDKLKQKKEGELGDQCFNYVFKNHHIDRVFEDLKKYFELNSFTYERLVSLNLFSMSLSEKIANSYVQLKYHIKTKVKGND